MWNYWVNESVMPCDGRVIIFAVGGLKQSYREVKLSCLWCVFLELKKELIKKRIKEFMFPVPAD